MKVSIRTGVLIAAALHAASPSLADTPDETVSSLGRLAGAAALCGIPPDQIKTVMAIDLDRAAPTSATLG